MQLLVIWELSRIRKSDVQMTAKNQRAEQE